MLDNAIKSQLAAYLDRLGGPVEFVASLDDGEKSADMRTLLRQIADLSPHVSVREDGQDARKPSFAIVRPGEPARVRFAGIPMGHEFTSLVLALLQVGGHPPKASAGMIERIRSLDGTWRFEIFVSLSCHNCPDTVQALNLLAVLNPGVETVMIDGALFQEEVAARGIMSVPTVLLNGRSFGQGRMTLDEIVAKLDQGARSREAARLGDLEPFDILVVGGGPAGAAAAVYAARKGIRTGVLSERFGGQVLDTLSIENLISVPLTEGPRLAAALEEHVRQYDVEVMNLSRAESLHPVGPDGLASVRTASGATIRARSVVLATGARWRELGVPGEQDYKGKGVCFCPHCDGPLFRGKRVAVIGGGNSGVEAAIDLAGLVRHVTLIEFDRQLRADAVLQERLRSLSNVEVRTGARTTEIRGDGRKVTGLVVEDRGTDRLQTIDVDGVFVQIGLLPNTEWLRDVVTLSARGEIEVDARGQTSVPGVFAAGDATTIPYKQIIVAMGQGATAALGAFEYLIRRPLQVPSALPAAA